MPRVPEIQPFQWPNQIGIEQNALAVQKARNELAAYPQDREYLQQERATALELRQAQIKKVLADVDEIARKAQEGEDVEAPFEWDGQPYSVSGKAERVRAVTAAGLTWPDQVDKNFLSWAATTHGVKIKPGRAEKVEKEDTKTDYQSARATLTEELGRLPTEGEIRKRIQADKEHAAAAGRAVFGTVATPTPGVYFDRVNKKWFKNDITGKPVELTSNEVKELNLQFKEETPTSDIRVMQQSVPSVLQLVGQTRLALQGTTTGPLAGRWKELWSGKVGAADPNFRKLKTDISLLQTRLMRMHVGARGGVEILKHFKEIIDSGKDSPENMAAALDEIEMYANEVALSIVKPAGEKKAPASPAPTVAPKKSKFTILEVK